MNIQLYSSFGKFRISRQTLFWTFSINSQESTLRRVLFLLKWNFIKGHIETYVAMYYFQAGLHLLYFPRNFLKIFRTPVNSWRLSLKLYVIYLFISHFYISILILWCIKKVKSPTKKEWNFSTSEFDFWWESNIFLLFQLSKQLKIYSRKLVQQNVFCFWYFPVAYTGCLHLERFKNTSLGHEFEF